MFDDLNPQVVIIVIAMLIGGLQWLMERLKKNRRKAEEEDVGESLEDLYEEARREIQERQARQYPTEAEMRERAGPSQPAAPPPTPPPPRPTPPSIPPPRQKPSFVASGAPPPIPGAPTTSRPVLPTLSTEEEAALKRFEALGTRRGRRGKPRSKSRVRQILSSPTAARDAIVLREILGPPKGAV